MKIVKLQTAVWQHRGRIRECVGGTSLCPKSLCTSLAEHLCSHWATPSLIPSDMQCVSFESTSLLRWQSSFYNMYVFTIFTTKFKQMWTEISGRPKLCSRSTAQLMSSTSLQKSGDSMNTWGTTCSFWWDNAGVHKWFTATAVLYVWKYLRCFFNCNGQSVTV